MQINAKRGRSQERILAASLFLWRAAGEFDLEAVDTYSRCWILWIHILEYVFLSPASGKVENGRGVATGTPQEGEVLQSCC